MELRRVSACIIVALACFCAGFVTREPHTRPTRENSFPNYEATINLSSDGKNDPAANAGKSANNYPIKGITDDGSKWWARPEWWQVIVAIIGISVIAWQSWLTKCATRATEIAAKAAQDNIALQGKQWVAFKRWQGKLQSLRSLLVSVEIANETEFPLKLEKTIFRVGTDERTNYDGVTIIPKGSYEVYFSVQLGEQDELDYSNPGASGGFAFSLRGAVEFSGVNGRTIQSFGGFVTASQFRNMVFTPTGDAEQSAKDHYKDES